MEFKDTTYKSVKENIKPNYSNIHNWEFYTEAVLHELTQCRDEGLDVEEYTELFETIAKLPKSEVKAKLGDVIYDIVMIAPKKEGYKYQEPSDLEGIRALRKPHKTFTYNGEDLEDKIKGAWNGRVCGCLLGKTVECIISDEFERFLKATDNFPMYRYITKVDVDSVDLSTYDYPLANGPHADNITGMPSDDDTNYTVMAQKIIENYGKGFTPQNVANAWLWYQPKAACCTAERVAYCNFVKGFQPPYSALYKNPYREWIGAQIRADYYGYICPGNPEMAAELAFKDASISHVKNGIYGAMFVAAMLSVAAVTDNIEDIILSGLAEIPETSRLYDDVMTVYNSFKNGVPQADVFKSIHEKFDENTEYGWCHTNPNAMIVTAALLYGEGDYGKSICMAVQTAFDTDCNGATVGSILGMANGFKSIPECWWKPVNDTLYTSLFGTTTVKITDAVNKTLEHIKK